MECLCAVVPVIAEDMPSEKFAKAFDPKQPRDKDGRWTSSGFYVSDSVLSNAWYGNGTDIHPAGNVSESNASSVLHHAGVDVSGFKREVADSELRHAFKSHGNDKSERKRGQRGITEDDFLKLQAITDEPDSVTHHVAAYRGGNTLEYQKTFGNERFVYVEAYSKKRKLVRFVSLRVHVKGGQS